MGEVTVNVDINYTLVSVSEMLLGEGNGQCVDGGAGPGQMCDSHCQCPSGKDTQHLPCLFIDTMSFYMSSWWHYCIHIISLFIFITPLLMYVHDAIILCLIVV